MSVTGSYTCQTGKLQCLTSSELTGRRTESISAEKDEWVKVSKFVHGSLEASCSSFWLLLSSLDVVDIVEMEDGNGGALCFCSSWLVVEMGGMMKKGGGRGGGRCGLGGGLISEQAKASLSVL